MKNLRIVLSLLIIGAINTACATGGVQIKKIDNGFALTNGKVKLECTKGEDGNLKEQYFAKNSNGNFVEVLRSFQPQYPYSTEKEHTKTFDTSITPERYLISEFSDIEINIDKQNNTIQISGTKGKVKMKQTIGLKVDATNFHVAVSCLFPKKINKIDYLMSTYEYNLNKAPFFVHSPGLKFDNEESKQHRWRIVDSQDQVIGDRSYHSPAIVLQEKSLFAALVPDLNEINEKRVVSPDARREGWIKKNHFQVDVVPENFTFPTALDLNVASGISDKPLMAFGYMDAIISHHIRYNRFNDSSMQRTFNGEKLDYAYDLFVKADAKDYYQYTDISQFIWNKYGHEEFEKGKHLAMPFKEYHRIVDSITFNPSQRDDIDIPLKGYANTGSWLQWEDKNGIKYGGYRSSINKHNDELHNSQFWNNAREAAGFWFWSKNLNYAKDRERAKRIINLCLSAPQNKHGLFATFYKANEKRWAPQFSDPMHGKTRFFLDDSDSYDISILSKTGAHLLHYYMTCEKDERIIEYLKPYADWLLTTIDERGAVPTYVSTNMEVSDILFHSAQPASSAWFLAQLYNATKEKNYLVGAEKIAGFLAKEIIPEAKWIDSEQFYSCGNRPLYFQRDIVQNQIARGSLCIMWAVEAYQALHMATNNSQYLTDGEACIEYLSFFQCSWNPHYIYTAYPFGGFSVDNADSGTYLDARQADVVKSFIYFGKKLGRLDLLERAVAAARSSIVLINHPLHKSNAVYEHTNIYPFGLGPENIDHEAYPQSAMRTHPSWGEGSGIFTGLAEVLQGLGSVYLNTEKKMTIGVDGVRVLKADYKADHASIQIESVLSEKYLNTPWQKDYQLKLKVDGSIAYVLVNNKRYNVNGGEVVFNASDVF